MPTPHQLNASFTYVASEAVRLNTGTDTFQKTLVVTLWDVAKSANRARASARFNVSVSMPWSVLPWTGDVLLVDSRGYGVKWQWSDVGRWLSRSLSGAVCGVTIQIKNGAPIPVKWSADRVSASVARVAAIDGAAVLADAGAKLASVAGWAVSERRSSVILAAWNMQQAAAALRVAQAVQAGGAWVDADVVPMPDPSVLPPVDPPPVDPPPVDPPPVDSTGIENAPLLAVGSVVGGVFANKADVDYFKISVSDPNPLNLIFSGVGATPPDNYSFFFIDPSGASVQFVTNWQGYMGFYTFTPNLFGDYFLVVQQGDGVGYDNAGYEVGLSAAF